MKTTNRFISMLLCFCLVAALLPSIALTASAEDPWLWPTYGIYAMYRGYYSGHQGIDISAPLQTPVHATKAGTVIESKNNCPHVNYGDVRCDGNPCNGGQGNYVKLQHDDGTYSRYLHLTQGTAIAVGTHVNQGDIVGYSGSSGDSSGPHLHFDCYNTSGVRFNNNPTDPRHTYTSTHDAGNLSYIYDTTPRMWFENSNMVSNIIFGRDFTFNCTVCSNSGVKWYALVIYDNNNTAVQIEGEDVWKVASTNSYPVTNAAQRLDFASLSEGNYRLSVQCMDNDDNYYTIYEKNFTVAKPTMWFENSNMTGSILQGNSYSLELTVCGNNGVKWYALVIYDSDNQAVQVEGEDVWRVASANSYPVTNAAQRLNFATLSAGDYRLSVQCMDNDDNYFTIYEKEFVVSPPAMWCEDINMPNEITVGNSFSLSGNICGNNLVKWYAIVIYDSNNTDVQNKSEAVWRVTDTNSYPITAVAEMIDFSILPVGDYRLSIQSMDKDDNYFGAYEKPFSVVSPIMWCENVNIPDELDYGQNFSLRGDICSNNLVKWYAIVIYDSNNVALQNKSEAVWRVMDTNTYPIISAADQLDFSVLSSGRYKLSIQSMDQDDNYYHAFEKEFTVRCSQHSYSQVVTEPTCTEQGYTTYTCSNCGESYVGNYVDALGHDYELTGWQWTGYTAAKATFTCKNDSSHVQTVNATITNVRTEPTCEVAGKVVYTAKVTFEGKDYTDTKTQTLDALDHNWNTPTYTWAADNSTVTATRTCKNDASHIETETVNTTSEVTTLATCTAKGKTTYTATFTNAAFATQTKNIENVPALGHTPAAAVKENEIAATCTVVGGYDMVVYCSVCSAELSREHSTIDAIGHNYELTGWTWTGFTAASATFTCKNDASHVEKVDATITSVRTEPTADQNGSVVYTAKVTFEESEYTDTKTDILPALGHDYELSGWNWTDYTAAAATFTDKNGGDLITVNATITSERTEPTCTEEGKVVYTATVTFEGKDYTDAKTETLDALGHDWNKPEYVWAEDYSAVTATRTCKNDASHVETETANATAEVIKEATVDEEGEVKYTATFANEAFEAQTKTVVTPKLDDPGDGLPCDGGDSCPGKIFTDMPAKDHWAHDAIDWAVVHDITSGTSATTFSPNASCTRAQVVTFLWRAAGSPDPTTESNPFQDVAADAWYYKAVLWASETGVTAGTSATTFSPNQTCTRGQIVTFIWRFEGSPEAATVNNPFADVPDDTWYTKAVLWASETGVTAGTSADKFSASATCTRAQIVTFLYRDMAS